MESQKQRVGVKVAVPSAIQYVKDLYGLNKIKDLLLEEVEFSDGANQWLVTVGFSILEDKDAPVPLIMPSLTSRLQSRRYKVVEIDAETGQPISMKIRVLQ